MPSFEADRDAAIVWARNLLTDGGAVILDTETTGLDNAAEVCQIGVLSLHGKVLLDVLCNPTVPIPAQATAIHTISDADVLGAALFDEVHVILARLLHERPVIIYNADFDTRILRQSCEAHNCPPLELEAHCAMEMYSQFVGDWNPRHGNYRWQRLPSGDHTAIGDCQATLRVIQRMATARLSSGATP